MLERNYNSEIISEEIKKLMQDMDKFITKKDLLADNWRKSFLTASNN